MTQIDIRPATANDVVDIVELLADDPLGSTRETPQDLEAYRRAFARIDDDPANHLVVAAIGDAVVGTLQLTIVPGLARAGMTRGLIEGVRTHREHRGLGIGKRLIEWAISCSSENGCGMVQLTSDSSRTGAHEFYKNMGFVHSHAGFKYPLS